ncbi:MAG: hypothetical protein R3E01_33780 [Pirellulaceae bacterium]|nr:hypothetical protein [Planctomycetales bacterium]
MTRIRSNPRRQGVVLVLVLICLTIVVAILTTMIGKSLRIRRQLLTERDARQAELWLDAALTRAVFQLRSDEHFAGESWNVSSSEKGDDVVADIALDRRDGQDSGRTTVNVVVRINEGRRTIVSRSRSFVVDLRAE